MRRKLFMISVIGILFSLSMPISAAELVRITNGEWPPFTSQQLQHGGPLSRIVSEAFALEGVTVEYGYFPWKRSYEYAKSGRWDGSVGWAPTSDHLQDFHMSKPVILVGKALFHLKSTPFDWKSIDDLRQWRIGGTAGYSYGVEWTQAVKSGRLKVEEVTIDEQNLRKLLLKRIDVMAMEIDVAEHLMQTLLSPEEAALITYHPRLVMQTSICLALSRQLEKSPGLMERFNRGLQRLIDNGTYDRIVGEFRQNNRISGRKNQAAELPRFR